MVSRGCPPAGSPEAWIMDFGNTTQSLQDLRISRIGNDPTPPVDSWPFASSPVSFGGGVLISRPNNPFILLICAYPSNTESQVVYIFRAGVEILCKGRRASIWGVFPILRIL